jgi:hypothetical protein
MELLESRGELDAYTGPDRYHELRVIGGRVTRVSVVIPMPMQRGQGRRRRVLDNEVGGWKALTIRRGAAAGARARRSQPGIIHPPRPIRTGPERCADT